MKYRYYTISVSYTHLLARAAGEAEREIDQKEREVENLCLKLLLQQQPVARDLREISSDVYKRQIPNCSHSTHHSSNIFNASLLVLAKAYMLRNDSLS